jgi:CheY-like chemotaxis protein
MAAVLGIVHAHHGAIRVVSTPGRGTTVAVFLPPSARRAAEEESPLPGRVAAPTAEGTVLVVDDDVAVLELERAILARAGYRVLDAAGGEAAVETLRGDTPVDAMVLDLTMPDMGGGEAFERARALRPDLPVVLVSGFDEADAVERFAARGLHAFLRKPFEPEDLIDKVRAALAR